MRVGAALRAGGQAVPELGPQGGQHQHRGPGRVPQQLPQPGGDPLAQPAVRGAEVELGLVQPHHGPRPDPGQVAQRRLGAGRVDRMPQPPPRLLVPQQPQRLPAGPGLARGGPADQHRDPAAALRRRPHHPGQLRIMAARHVHRQCRQPGLGVVGLDRPVHLQGERISHLGQRPPPDLLTPAPAASAPARAGQLSQRAFHQLPQRARAREGLRGQAAVLDPAAERVLAGRRTRGRSTPTAGYPHRQRRCPAGTPAGPGPPQWRCRTPAPYRTPPACPAPQSHIACPAPRCTRRIRAPAQRTPAREPDRPQGNRPYPRPRARPPRSPAPPPPRTTTAAGSPAARRCARGTPATWHRHRNHLSQPRPSHPDR